MEICSAGSEGTSARVFSVGATNPSSQQNMRNAPRKGFPVNMLMGGLVDSCPIRPACMPCEIVVARLRIGCYFTAHVTDLLNAVLRIGPSPNAIHVNQWAGTVCSRTVPLSEN